MRGRPSFVFPEAKLTPSRFRYALNKYRVKIGNACTNCGLCIEICPYRVYAKGSKRPRTPSEHLCAGPICEKNAFFCVRKCPVNAITVQLNPSFELLGDKRWTGDLLASTWYMAEVGEVPYQNLNYKTGDSGGGFDKLRFLYTASGNGKKPKGSAKDISLSIALNRSGDNRPKVTIPVPFYLGGMSFGSISINAMLSRVRAATALGTFCSTGEGGYPNQLMPYDDHIITQVATGLFGVREDTIQRVRIVEFKYAQGAKPGLGGHLLGDKVTLAVAKMREAVAGSALSRPSPSTVSIPLRITRNTLTGSK